MDLRAVAEIVVAAQAARPVVVLDCAGDVGGFTRGALMSVRWPSFRFLADPFTSTLARALNSGVLDGPEELDLVTLKNAIDASFEEIRYFVENDCIGGATRVHLRGGQDVALAVNPALSTGGGLYRDPGVIEEVYADWW